MRSPTCSTSKVSARASAIAPAGRIHGVVLAGGQSRRMGRDKAGVTLDGRSLLGRTCDRLAPQCASVAVSRHDPAGTPARDYPTIPDGTAHRAGPLAGILAALDWTAARDPGATHVVTAAVDMPFLPLDLVPRLDAARAASRRPIACATSSDRVHPVAALWPVALRNPLRDCLLSERISRLMTVVERFGFATADWPVDPFDPFLNVNTPDDLAGAEAVAAMLRSVAGPDPQ